MTRWLLVFTLVGVPLGSLAAVTLVWLTGSGPALQASPCFSVLYGAVWGVLTGRLVTHWLSRRP